MARWKQIETPPGTRTLVWETAEKGKWVDMTEVSQSIAFTIHRAIALAESRGRWHAGVMNTRYPDWRTNPQTCVLLIEQLCRTFARSKSLKYSPVRDEMVTAAQDLGAWSGKVDRLRSGMTVDQWRAQLNRRDAP